LKTDDIFICSNEAIIDMFPAGRMDLPPGDGPNKRRLRASYGGNFWVLDGAQNPPSYQTLLLGVMSVYGEAYTLNRSSSDIRQPSEAIMITDAWNLWIGAPVTSDFCDLELWKSIVDTTFPTRGSISLRHSGGFNALFTDTHARWLRKSTWQMWAADPSQVPLSATKCPKS
jgi:prepilin-type processing-associated H-X9-DG protein